MGITMRNVLFFTILLLSNSIFGADGHKLLKCLGKEEKKLHKSRSTGPHYQLNQKFINEMTGFRKVDIKNKYLNKICHKKISASEEFLRALLVEGQLIFNHRPPSDDTVNLYQEKLLEDFFNRLPEIFFNYLGDLEAVSTTPNCLSSEIPEVKFIQLQYFYLGPELKGRVISDNKAKIKRIFRRLRNIEQIYIDCAKKAQLQNKLKKQKTP